MGEKAPADTKSDLIERILEIELSWFLTVNPQLTSECQEHPEAFRLMRQAPFETWSEQTLALHLEHLVDAQGKGRNLVREKYAKIEESIPCVNLSLPLHNSIEIEERWFKEAVSKYPNILAEEAGAGFIKYLRCELDTFSQETLESYYKDRLGAETEGKNLVIEIYNIIAQKIGFSSIEEWNQQQGR